MISWAGRFTPAARAFWTPAQCALAWKRTSWRTRTAVLAEFGNMSSPTVLFILDRICRRGGASPCVILAFGPGLSIEAALFR